MRELLEGTAAGLAAENATKAEMQLMRMIVSEERISRTRGTSPASTMRFTRQSRGQQGTATLSFPLIRSETV